MVYMILDGVEITSAEQLETLIADLPEESKTSLRLIFESAQTV
jgi:hypothetical protein